MSPCPPIQVTLQVAQKPLNIEVDTGATVSIISEATKKKYFPEIKLQTCKLVLKTYTNEPMPVLGQLHVGVCYQGQSAQFILYVVPGNGPTLMGRNWLKYIWLDWHRIATIHNKPIGLNDLLDKHKALFKDELRTVHPKKAILNVKPDATPRFFKPRPVLFSVKEAIGKELDRLEEQGILKKVDSSDWAAPIVPVPKKDGRFRICGDYKVTINQALTVDQYPLPKPEDLFATLANGKHFTKLDISQAYLQLALEEDSMKYVTINRHQSLYQFTRLPFGIASAIFQRHMDKILHGLPGVICYIDDILVTGKDDEEHL